jgi:hypothetical protein
MPHVRSLPGRPLSRESGTKRGRLRREHRGIRCLARHHGRRAARHRADRVRPEWRAPAPVRHRRHRVRHLLSRRAASPPSSPSSQSVTARTARRTAAGCRRQPSGSSSPSRSAVMPQETRAAKRACRQASSGVVRPASSPASGWKARAGWPRQSQRHRGDSPAARDEREHEGQEAIGLTHVRSLLPGCLFRRSPGRGRNSITGRCPVSRCRHGCPPLGRSCHLSGRGHRLRGECRIRWGKGIFKKKEQRNEKSR